MPPSGCSPSGDTRPPASPMSGPAAGVSRGTPGYFFGSKAELYRAVLERCFAEVRAAVRSGRERALASGEPPEMVLAGVVSEYFDFIAASPNFVRLIEWEALTGGRHAGSVPRTSTRRAGGAGGAERRTGARPGASRRGGAAAAQRDRRSAGSRWCTPARPAPRPGHRRRPRPDFCRRASAT